MSPDPQEDPPPDNNKPPHPPNDNKPPPTSDGKEPPPARDEAARIRRLHLLWRQWDQIRGLLLCMARSSGLPPTDGELAVDEVLDRLITVTVSDNPPEFPLALARVAMQRLLGEIRACGCAICLDEDMNPATLHRPTASACSLDDFWEWVENHSKSLKSQLTALQWQTLMATKDARTIDTAASRCSQLPINYRNTTQRLGKKISKKIQEGSVPPPLLKSEFDRLALVSEVTQGQVEQVFLSQGDNYVHASCGVLDADCRYQHDRHAFYKC